MLGRNTMRGGEAGRKTTEGAPCFMFKRKILLRTTVKGEAATPQGMEH